MADRRSIVEDRVYAYKGKRSKEKLVDFARETYLRADSQPKPLRDRMPSDNDFFEALQVIEAWAKKNLVVSLAFTAFFFMMIGCCMGTLLEVLTRPAPRPRRRAAEAPEKAEKESKQE